MAQIYPRSSADLSTTYSQSSELLHDNELYTEQSDSEQCDFRHKESWSPGLSKTSKFHLACKLILVSLALWGSIDVLRRSSEVLLTRISNRNPECWCGNSDSEAVALGCKYDHLAVDWLPPHCIDEELTAEFDRAGPGHLGAWDYFADPEGSQRLNQSEIDIYAISGKNYFTTREWHIAHCVYTWRKEFRVRYTSKSMESWNENEGHIIHCGKYFMEGPGLSIVDTIIPGTDRHKRED